MHLKNKLHRRTYDVADQTVGRAFVTQLRANKAFKASSMRTARLRPREYSFSASDSNAALELHLPVQRAAGRSERPGQRIENVKPGTPTQSKISHDYLL